MTTESQRRRRDAAYRRGLEDGRAERQLIGQQIINICAGKTFENSLYAQADALATGIGGAMQLSGHTLAEAEELADEIGKMIRQHVRKNWGTIEVAQ
nr:hypothetical protein 2 [Spirochaetaceae bacterium]BDD44746.1 hypothetical protein 4 [bacterium]BDD45559.1 hypothetical protein 8 [bacterium]